jgi:transposase
MAYEAATRNKVRAKYVQGLPLNTAAEACKVPYNTARNWKRAAEEEGEDWDLMRTARRMTSSGAEGFTNQVLGELAEQFLATIKLLKDDKKMPAAQRAQILMQLGDSYSKAMAAASRAAPNTNRLATVMDSQRFIAEQVKKLAPKIHADFLRVLEASGGDLVREFGGGR